MVMPSLIATVLNSIGVPPAARMPCLDSANGLELRSCWGALLTVVECATAVSRVECHPVSSYAANIRSSTKNLVSPPIGDHVSAPIVHRPAKMLAGSGFLGGESCLIAEGIPASRRLLQTTRASGQCCQPTKAPAHPSTVMHPEVWLCIVRVDLCQWSSRCSMVTSALAITASMAESVASSWARIGYAIAMLSCTCV
jgi:hypothetical protein